MEITGEEPSHGDSEVTNPLEIGGVNDNERPKWQRQAMGIGLAQYRALDGSWVEVEVSARRRWGRRGGEEKEALLPAAWVYSASFRKEGTLLKK